MYQKLFILALLISLSGNLFSQNRLFVKQFDDNNKSDRKYLIERKTKEGKI